MYGLELRATDRVGKLVREKLRGCIIGFDLFTGFVDSPENITPASSSKESSKCQPTPDGDKIKTAHKKGLHLVDILFHGGRNTRQRS